MRKYQRPSFVQILSSPRFYHRSSYVFPPLLTVRQPLTLLGATDYSMGMVRRQSLRTSLSSREASIPFNVLQHTEWVTHWQNRDDDFTFYLYVPDNGKTPEDRTTAAPSEVISAHAVNFEPRCVL